ncbi:hypothetical protein [Stenotrophomonas phage BUCT609]|uniref:Uncharacterized protein n=1 Tax=Stenotrophomonas phage BUCT609 TaxID=2834250 RepID=A0A8E6URU1_9CAUD|nr:hypothetical protein [Stenotrophomonas phage BUCT609]
MTHGINHGVDTETDKGYTRHHVEQDTLRGARHWTGIVGA